MNSKKSLRVSSSSVVSDEATGFLPDPVNIALLVTDLDGTLIGRSNQMHLYPRFNELIAGFRKNPDFKWVVCTGRFLRSYKVVMQPLHLLGLQPDYVVARHAYIYSCEKVGYIPHFIWNVRTIANIMRKKLQTSSIIDKLYEMLCEQREAGVPGCIYRNHERLVLRFESEESAANTAVVVRQQLEDHRYLSVFRYLRDLDIRLVPFTKGLAVKQLAMHLGLSAADILVIGNGHNDVSMMRKDVAHFYGCPRNSDAEVIDLVHDVGGHVARNTAMAGVIEIIEAVLGGAVDSSYPPGWTPAQNQAVRLSHRLSSHRKKAAEFRRVSLVAAMAAILLLVLANFNLLPLSSLIMKPVHMFSGLLWRLIMSF